MGLICQVVAQRRLEAGIRPGCGGAISLTQEFPSLSAHIRNLAPYGRQILLLACEPLAYYTHIFMHFWRKDMLFFCNRAKSYVLAFLCSSRAAEISQRNRCFQLANMVADASHATHARSSPNTVHLQRTAFISQPMCGTRTSGTSEAC